MTHTWWVCKNNIRSVLPDGESAWKLILCVHKELRRNDSLNKCSWRQCGHRYLEVQKLESISIAQAPLCYLLFLSAITQKILAGFLVSRGWGNYIKANQKGSFRVESYDMSVQVMKILIDLGSLTHKFTSSFSELSSSGEGVPKSLRKSGHILPGAGSVQL